MSKLGSRVPRGDEGTVVVLKNDNVEVKVQRTCTKPTEESNRTRGVVGEQCCKKCSLSSAELEILLTNHRILRTNWENIYDECTLYRK